MIGKYNIPPLNAEALAIAPGKTCLACIPLRPTMFDLFLCLNLEVTSSRPSLASWWHSTRQEPFLLCSNCWEWSESFFGGGDGTIFMVVSSVMNTQWATRQCLSRTGALGSVQRLWSWQTWAHSQASPTAVQLEMPLTPTEPVSLCEKWKS